jgi:hypothetical protein
VKEGELRRKIVMKVSDGLHDTRNLSTEHAVSLLEGLIAMATKEVELRKEAESRKLEKNRK